MTLEYIQQEPYSSVSGTVTDLGAKQRVLMAALGTLISSFPDEATQGCHCFSSVLAHCLCFLFLLL